MKNSILKDLIFSASFTVLVISQLGQNVGLLIDYLADYSEFFQFFSGFSRPLLLSKIYTNSENCHVSI